MPAPLVASAQHNHQPSFQRTSPSKNVKHKSSKPIINWLQRKLAGTVRSRRPSVANNVRGSSDSTYSGRATSLKELRSPLPHGRVPAPRDVDENGHLIRDRRPISKEISLNSTGFSSDEDSDEDSDRRSSGITTSMWGSRSNPLEADEDASIRPLPPTSPPSPSPSRSPSLSSSSYMSDLRTFKSLTASTKPTTLLSIDSNPGVAHIAQAPPTPTSVSGYNITPAPSPVTRFPPHIRQSSSGYGSPVGLVTFSALPPSTPPSSRPSSLGPAIRTGVGALQAPAHTSHHPRNNPRPSSPPLDNASVLTLASSAFAAPLVDRGRQTPFQYSWANGTDTASHISHMDGGGDSLSHIILDGELAGEEQSASVRALRPRSSRRDSWESEVSRWSAGVSVLGTLAANGRDRSVRTAPSFRTGGQYTVDDNISLVDEDLVSTREDCLPTEEDVSRISTKDDVEDDPESAFSPLFDVSTEGVEEASVSIDSDARNSESTEVDAQSLKESTTTSNEIDEVATPGPAGRTLILVPSNETMPAPDLKGSDFNTRDKRPNTPPMSATSKDTETTPKKEKKKNIAPSEKDIEN